MAQTKMGIKPRASKPRSPRIRSASPRSRRFGFPADWNVTVVDDRGKVAYDTIPSMSGTWVLTKGNDFVSESGFDDSEVEEAGGLLPFLRENFSVAEADGLCFVGDDPASVARAVSEWETREDRMPPAEIAGMKLTPGGREGVAIVTFEGRPRPDMAAYVDALTGSNWRCDPSKEFMWDGWFDNLRRAADMDPGFLSDFADGNLPDEPENAYDREILAVIGRDEGSASVRGRSAKPKSKAKSTKGARR